MAHRATTKNHGFAYQIICSCGERSALGTKQQVEDWELAHAVKVQQLRSRLRGQPPSLASQLNWYTSQANNPENTEYDRGLWRVLASELEARIHQADEGEQLSLW